MTQTQNFGQHQQEATVRVRLGTGVERLIMLNDQPLDAQIRAVCLQFGLRFDDGNFFVLTHGTSAEATPIKNLRGLWEANQYERVLGLASGLDLIRTQLNGVREGTEAQDVEAMHKSLRLLLANLDGVDCALMEQAISEDAMDVLCGAVCALSPADFETIEVAMACTCALLQSDLGMDRLMDWSDDNEADRLDFHQTILGALFALPREAPPDVPMYSSVFFYTYVLHEIQDIAMYVHEALESCPTDNLSLYQRLVDAIDPEDFQDFSGSAAVSMISALTVACGDDETLEAQVESAIQECRRPDDESLWDLLQNPYLLTDNILALSLNAGVSLNCAQASEALRGEAVEKAAHLQRNNDRLTEVNHFMQEQCRRWQRILTKIAPFVQVPGDRVVQETMPSILVSGWDSLHFKRGYSVLHYAAEFVEDPAVIEMLVAFCTNPQQPDDGQMTPLDYAKKSGHAAVIRVLEDFLNEPSIEEAEEKLAKQPSEPRTSIEQEQGELQKKLETMEHVPAKLRMVMESVVKLGWQAIVWPSGFTALHLAAKCGHAPCFRFLVEAGADIEALDDWSLSPLDYAVQGRHHEMVELIQRYQFERLEHCKSDQSDQPEAGKTFSIANLSTSKTRVSEGTGGSTPHGVTELESLSIAQLRLKVHQLIHERAALVDERDKLQQQQGQQVDGANADLRGPLSEEQLRDFYRVMSDVGKEGVLAKLTAADGLSYAPEKAAAAMKQLELVVRLAGLTPQSSQGQKEQKEQVLPRASVSWKGAGKVGPAVPEGGEVQGKGGKGSGQGEELKGGGKGKGPAGKGKVKGKGPASPSKKVKVEPTKSKRKPTKKVRGVWWGEPLLMGKDLHIGTTIWDEVNDETELLPLEELSELFSTERAGCAGGQETKKEEGTKEKKPKYIETITDANELMMVEGILERLPAPDVIAFAVESLSETLLNEDQVFRVMKAACPTEEQLLKLQAMRDARPDAPLSASSQYFEVVGRILHAKDRCVVWNFTRTVYESVNLFSGRIKEFQTLCERLLNSQGVASLLSIVLATGNYLNGGTNRGQADGVDLTKCLTAFGNCKDRNGHELTGFVLRVFYNRLAPKFRKCIDELTPVLQNVKKMYIGDKFEKKCIVCIEDFDAVIKELQKECAIAKESLDRALSGIDHSNQFYIQMPKKYKKADDSIKNLLQLKEDAVSKYNAVLTLFHMNKKTKSDEFCLLWDNLLVPPDKAQAMDSKLVEAFFNPYFCKGAAPNLYSLLVFWGIREFSETEAARQQGDGKDKKRRGAVAVKSGSVSSMHQAVMGAVLSTVMTPGVSS